MEDFRELQPSKDSKQDNREKNGFKKLNHN